MSGFAISEFTFFGFLPRQKGELKEKLLDMARRSRLAVVHESPHRVRDLLDAVAETLPHTRVSASCDLTKRYEKPCAARLRRCWKPSSKTPRRKRRILPGV